MAKYKAGDKVISRPKSAGCAPEGITCTVIRYVPRALYTRDHPFYEVKTPEGHTFKHFEDELELHKCDYCQKGKSFNTIYYGDMTVKSYILGNKLNTDVHDDVWPDEDEGKAIKITHCPFCGTEVHELPDEEMEEIEEEE